MSSLHLNINRQSLNNKKGGGIRNPWCLCSFCLSEAATAATAATAPAWEVEAAEAAEAAEASVESEAKTSVETAEAEASVESEAAAEAPAEGLCLVSYDKGSCCKHCY